MCLPPEVYATSTGVDCRWPALASEAGPIKHRNEAIFDKQDETSALLQSADRRRPNIVECQSRCSGDQGIRGSLQFAGVLQMLRRSRRHSTVAKRFCML